MIHLASFLLAFLFAATVPALLATLALIPWRRLSEEPWTERARRFNSIRIGHASWLLVLPFTAMVGRLWFIPAASLPAILVGIVLGSTLSSWPMDRALFPSYRIRNWLASSVVLSLMQLGWVFLALLFALLMPDTPSLAQLGWVIGFLAATGALSGGLIYRLLVTLGSLKPAGERLTRLVQECAAEAGIPVKSVWEISTPAGYAAALVVQRALVFSTATAAEHDDEELRAICRHELAHLKEGPGLIALRVAQLPVTMLPFIFIPTAMTTLGPLGILVPLLIWILLQRMFARISLRLEKRADAAVHHGAESPAYARALERLHRRNLLPAVLAPKAARTHPDLYDRMIAAGVTPGYPRPAPPPQHHWLAVSAQLLGGATMLGWLLYWD